MGLLMRTPLPHGRRISPGRIIRPGVLLITALIAGGCTNVRLGQPLIQRPGDWPTFAMTEQRVMRVLQPLPPPLALEWDANIQGGMGNGSPLVVDSLVILGTQHGDLLTIRVRTGSFAGAVSLGDAIHGSPVIRQGVALVALTNTTESLVAFDLTEGRIQWKQRYGDIEVSPLLFAKNLYFGNTEGIFYCVNPFSGDQTWNYVLPHNAALKGIRSSPAGAGSTIVFGADNDSVYALAAGSGERRWVAGLGAPVMGGPSIGGDTVYAATIAGRVVALSLQDGHLVWSFEAGSPVYGTPTLSGDLVVVGTTAGRIDALRASDGILLWSTEVGGPVNSSAVPAGDVLYVGTLKRTLKAIRATDGSIVWSTEVSGRIKTTPAIAAGRLFVVTDDRELLSFKPAPR
jgi:eukaryotic-like serine/threonine-protein kinase